jgi:hypothetical protein
MRRITIIGTAVAVLVVAGSAFAATALNTYTASHPVSPSKAGSTKSPLPVSVTDSYVAHNATAGQRTAPLIDIKTKIYGLVSNGKYFPTCSLTKISGLRNDNTCPKGALVASGSLYALIGNPRDPSASGTPCSPILHVWNGGQGKVVFFFNTDASHVCFNGAIHTGSVGPYPGTIKMQGKWYVLDVPIPDYISFPVGLEGSLVTEHLVWPKKTTKVHGKTVAYMASVACMNRKRPYSTSFTAETDKTGANKQTTTISGASKCSK